VKSKRSARRIAAEANVIPILENSSAANGKLKVNSEVEAKIQSSKVLGEIDGSSYRSIRITRIKYKASPETHIDIRQFQRGYDDDGEEVYFPTKKGFQFLEWKFKRFVANYTITPESFIHKTIAIKCFKLLNSGEYSSAVIAAFKQIEIAIREKVDYDPELVGIKLIRKAFNAENGPLANRELPVSERESFCNYLAGAFGFYKNPCSHRDVELDFESAFDRIIVASDLLKAVEKS
jgi:uncharacterized protein (TIGR02391 family)